MHWLFFSFLSSRPRCEKSGSILHEMHQEIWCNIKFRFLQTDKRVTNLSTDNIWSKFIFVLCTAKTPLLFTNIFVLCIMAGWDTWNWSCNKSEARKSDTKELRQEFNPTIPRILEKNIINSIIYLDDRCIKVLLMLLQS